MKIVRAYSTLEIKATSENGGKRMFSGIASTPSTDRMGDIVEPKGAQFKLPIPLLWQHDSRQPIGWIHRAKVTDAGIEVEGEIADIAEEGSLRERLREAWHSLKIKLVRGLSIGFNPIEMAEIKGTWGYRFTKWEWLELSAVTIPANQDASIVAIKSLDHQQRAALGLPTLTDDRAGNPGASGIAVPASRGHLQFRSLKGSTMKTIQQLREERTTKAARMREILELRNSESRNSTDDEAVEFDTLTSEVRGLDDEIRVMQFDAINGAAARPVDGLSSDGASRTRGPTVIVRKTDAEEAFKGQSFTRRVIARALAHLEQRDPATIAQARWGKSAPTLVQVIKADVAGGGAGSGEWGAELVQADTRFTGDFIEYLHGMTVFDRLPLVSVPANVAIKGQDGAGTGYWVGESKSIPATAMDFSTVSLSPLKVAALAVVSNELLRDSSPSAERLVRDALAEASAQRVDTTFLSVTAASSGVSPAGILNGLTINTTTGATADDLRDDLAGLLEYFITLKYNLSGLVVVTTPAIAMQVQMMRNSLGQREFPDVSMGGGTIEGLPVFTGHNVGTGDLIMMSARDIWKIGDGGVSVSISREAMIEQDSAPQGATDTPTTASTKFTSMFQAESTAIKVVRSINFAKRRASAVAYIGNAQYGTPASV
jgi:HK97 family phage major capsid protein/HK97 family phage prohead protease